VPALVFCRSVYLSIGYQKWHYSSSKKWFFAKLRRLCIVFVKKSRASLQSRKDFPVNPKRFIPWIIYLLFFAVLNETMFNVSTPKIAEQFSLSASGVGWVMTIFLVFFGIGSAIYGRLSDLYSLKRLIVIGVLLYTVGSLLGFVLQFSYPMVVLARAIQGIGASALPPLIFVSVARYFPETERGRVFGLLTSTVSVAIGFGPIIGGFVSGTIGWAYLFLLPVLTLLALPFLNRELPNEPRREGSVDLAGAVLVALTVGALVLYLNISMWYYLVAFVVFLLLLLWRINTAREPFIAPSLFKNVRFRNGVIVGFALFSVVIGNFFLVPLMLHDVHQLDTRLIGLVLFPGAISAVAFGPIGGNLADRRGNSFVVTIGLILLAASLVVMALFLGVSPYIIGAALLLNNIGFTLFQTAMMNSVSQTLEEHEAGTGMGLYNLVSIISGAVGTALVGKVLDGGWLDIALVPTLGSAGGHAYSNVMLAFSIIIVLGGLLYLSSYRNPIVKPLPADD
jgi:MFS transporter, DHA2 family, metal-tetracycline-proton antiporter